MALTYKQRAFVEHFLGDAQWNATEAARRAGYKGSRNTLAVVGFENLRKPKIQEQIHRRLLEMGASTQELVWRWLARIRADISPFVSRGGLDIRALREAGLGHLIKGVRRSQHVTNVELRDPDKAEELLAKHLGMFVERHEIKKEEVIELEWPDEGHISPSAPDTDAGVVCAQGDGGAR